MSQDVIDTDRIVRRLLRDAVATLGVGAEAEVLRLADVMAENAAEQMRPVAAGPHWEAQPGRTLAEAQRFFDREVVDHFQLAVHDEHWDTTWPACPRHPNHPLSYAEEHEAWCCPRDGVPVVPLGKLAELRPVAS